MSIIRNIVNKINPAQGSRVGESEMVAFNEEGRILRHSGLDKLFLALIIMLVATLSFGIGRLSVVGERAGVSIEYDPQLTTINSEPTTGIQTTQTASVINATKGGEVVVSKNGSKYHYLHCSGAKQIKEENKVTFSSPSAAESAGYTLAANCKPR